MTLPAFAELVSQMRAAQRRYFRDRSSKHLAESKSLEQDVDKAVAAILFPEVLPMFPEDV